MTHLSWVALHCMAHSNIDFTATSGAFKAGTGEYVTLFEPTASMLEKEGSGKIIASIHKFQVIV